MSENFIQELKWRGLIHNITPQLESRMTEGYITGYIGFDPTADSLHVGNLVPIILLRHFQKYGHKPIALLGGATGMIGDPSGKSKERNLLDEQTLKHNTNCIKSQLANFLNFNDLTSRAEIVNNYDWMKDFNLIDFMRDVGKHITINYMTAKDSVNKRVNAEGGEGMSFTEFAYQLFQGYDFAHLYKTKNCLLQMGGSDQWGNITTGIELTRRIHGAKAYAVTCPLITKADGSKFGKTEMGNVWLDPKRTSPYRFYQFWLNADDIDAEKYIKIFTFLPKDEVETIIAQHKEQPHLRLLQRTIAEQLTSIVHSEKDLENAIKASQILFGKTTFEDLKSLDEKTFLEVFEGVSTKEISRKILGQGLSITDTLFNQTGFLKSNSDARRALKENAISLNKQKVDEHRIITLKDLINNKYLLLQRGKKHFFLINII